MFTSLRSRLWLTYVIIVGVVLSVIGVALILYLLRNPSETRQTLIRLRLVSTIIQQRDKQLDDLSPESLQTWVERAEAAYNVRVAVQNSLGRTLVDSHADTAVPLPNLSNPPRGRIAQSKLSFRDTQGRIWLYALRPLEDGNYLVVAAPRPRTPVVAIFRDEFVSPFVQTGILAMFLALLLAFWMAGWVMAPLRRIATAARRVTAGEFHPISLQGPSEVQEVVKIFNQMTERVQASQQSQRDFVANVSHELKTPLTSIQGYAQAILDGTVDSPEGLKQAAGVIHAESERMHRMVLNLLDLARLDAGIAALERAPLDLSKLLQSVVDKFVPIARDSQVDFRAEIEALPVIIGDADRLAQVFTNLVDNAIKHSPVGEEIFVRANQIADQVEISVMDKGPGIPPEDLSRIFERFYQTDKSRRGGRDHGVGLGLTIAYEIVQAHGGTLSVSNNSLQGCVFVVKIPIIRPEDSTLARES